MLISDLIAALVIAAVLAFVLGAGVRRQPVGSVLLAMFAVLFLATWAGGAWMAPVGPRVAGTHVASFVIVGLVLALLMTAFIPRHPPRTRGEALRQADARRQTATFIIVFFWLAVAALLAGIALRYL